MLKCIVLLLLYVHAVSAFVAVCVCVRSRAVDFVTNIRYTPLMNTLVPSFRRTTVRKDDARLYVAIDSDDFYYNRYLKVIQSVATVVIVNKALLNGRIPFNEITQRAQDDGAEYIVRVNDDTEFVTNNWVQIGKDALMKMDPPNVGVVVKTQNKSQKINMVKSTKHGTSFMKTYIVNKPKNINPLLSDRVLSLKQTTAHQDVHCWNEVDYGLFKNMTVPKDPVTSLACTYLPHPHSYHSSKAMLYCTFPPGVQIYTAGLSSVKSINMVHEDGYAHDPRYKILPSNFLCDMNTRAYPAAVFDFHLKHTLSIKPKNISCLKMERRECRVHFTMHILLLQRKDDHNIFFMLSLLLNLWAFGPYKNAQIIFMDDAGKQPIDEIFKALITPGIPIIYANEFIDKVWCFDIQPITVFPSEYHGPLLPHLDDAQKCRKSTLIQNFVKQIKTIYGFFPFSKVHHFKRNFTVTFVTRSNYNGRHLQRILTNENEIVKHMQVGFLHIIILLCFITTS